MQLTKEQKRAELLSKFGMKKTEGKPNSIREEIAVGKITKFGTELVKDDDGTKRPVLFVTLTHPETNEANRFWVDSGLRTSLNMKKIVEFPEGVLDAEKLASDVKINYTGVLAIEHIGKVDIGGGKTANQYDIFMQEA